MRYLTSNPAYFCKSRLVSGGRTLHKHIVDELNLSERSDKELQATIRCFKAKWYHKVNRLSRL